MNLGIPVAVLPVIKRALSFLYSGKNAFLIESNFSPNPEYSLAA